MEIRKPVYLSVPWQSIDFKQVLALMVDVQWDIGDIMSQHSSYVDHLLQVRFLGLTFLLLSFSQWQQSVILSILPGAANI